MGAGLYKKWTANLAVAANNRVGCTFLPYRLTAHVPGATERGAERPSNYPIVHSDDSTVSVRREVSRVSSGSFFRGDSLP